MKKLKLVHAQNVTGIAGSENYLLQTLPALVEKGHEVLFICLFPGNPNEFQSFKRELERSGVLFYPVPFNVFWILPALLKISKLLKKDDFDVVHTHLIHADIILALTKFIYGLKIPIVSTKHGYEEWYNNKFGFDPSKRKFNLYYVVERFAERFITRSFAISKGLQNLYTGLKITNPEKMDLVYYGFDFATNSDVTLKPISNHQLVIVGRLTSFKGHRYAFKAVSILKTKFEDLKLLVIGSGDLENQLKREVKELGIEEQVEFLGYKPDGAEYMSVSDVVLIPSISEGFGVVVLEAFNAKTPIVAFDVPSLNEHIDSGKNGVLVKPYDTDQFAQEIENLLTDKAYANALAEGGFSKLINYYNRTRMISETEQFYDSVLH